MHIKKIENNINSFRGSMPQKNRTFKDIPYWQGLALSAGVGAAAPALLLLDGEKFKNVKKEFNLKTCAKYATIFATLYSVYKFITGLNDKK